MGKRTSRKLRRSTIEELQDFVVPEANLAVTYDDLMRLSILIDQLIENESDTEDEECNVIPL